MEATGAGDDGGGKKSSGGGSAAIKELSKLLATAEDMREAKLARQQLERRYRAIREELNPLLAIPTAKQLDDEMAATEEKLRRIREEISAVKDRMAKPNDSLQKQKQHHPSNCNSG